MAMLCDDNAMGLSRRTVKARLAAVFAAALIGLSATAVAAKPVKIVAFGDSLTAGYRLPPDSAFPVQLEAALKAKGIDVAVVNAGVSGDTTADGRDRLDWSVPADASLVIVELGANDALRGLDPAKARANLASIIETLQKRGQSVLLAGMIAPKSMGDSYTHPFDAMYPALAAKYGVPLYPLFIAPIIDDAKLRLDDGLHPTTAGVAAIVKGILPSVVEALSRTSGTHASVP